MKLTGEIILDDDTMVKLREQIREEIIGNYGSEIKCFLEDCNYSQYMRFIKKTIVAVIKKTDKDEINWNFERKEYQKLLMIRDLLKM